jgi:pyruvate kinase
MHRYSRTKILCTLGPSTSDVEILMSLIKAGMDVARLNFSHGSYDDHARILGNLRTAAERTGEAIAAIQDLQGPKIRVGLLAGPSVELKAGGRIVITTKPLQGTAERVSTDFQNLPQDVKPGEPILIDDGRIRLRVLEVTGTEVLCEVLVGGVLSAHKGINLPGVAVSTPSLTEKDRKDLAWGIAHGIDGVALSFVRTAEDVRELRRALQGLQGSDDIIPVYAKIEKPQAITNLDAIIAEADGVMVARGDLGVEMPPEDVPILQKRIVRACAAAGKPVIIATQMLESMIHNPIPTRAEANDVANAVMDGADAVMLSGETSVGSYPLETVQMMDRIIQRVEEERAQSERSHEGEVEVMASRHDALARAACVLGEQMNATAIVAVTNSGQTARALAKYRPTLPIVAITDRPQTLRRVAILWGVRGMLMSALGVESDKALQTIQEQLLISGIVKKGDYVVLLAGLPFFARGSTNIIKVEKIA